MLERTGSAMGWLKMLRAGATSTSFLLLLEELPLLEEIFPLYNSVDIYKKLFWTGGINFVYFFI